MKLDLFKYSWLDIVFEGRNKSYGAYDLRKSNGKTTTRALIIGTILFALAVSIPMIMKMIPSASDSDESLNTTVKVTKVKLPPKEEKKVIELKPNQPPPPPPPPRVDQVKFTKPVVAKADEVTEIPPKMEDLKDKAIGDKNLKGDKDAVLTIGAKGDGPPDSKTVEAVPDNKIYSTAGLEQQPEFPGGNDKFGSFIQKNFAVPDDESFQGGKILVSFVVEKDGSLTDIKVEKDPGYGTAAEAIRVLKKSPKWRVGEQNGVPVRVSYKMPIVLANPNE